MCSEIYFPVRGNWIFGVEMPEDKGFPVSIDDLMAQIRSEVSARNPGKVAPAPTSACPKDAPQGNPCPNTIVAELEPASEPQPFECKEGGYHIRDFLKFHDQDFVLNAYRGILQRDADPAGLQAHITGNLSERLVNELKSYAFIRMESLRVPSPPCSIRTKLFVKPATLPNNCHWLQINKVILQCERQADDVRGREYILSGN